MKKGSIFSSPPSDSKNGNNENDSLENLEQKPNDIKVKNNNNSFNDSISVSENVNKDQMEQSELNNFDIEFFLPNELQEDLNLNKNSSKDQDDNTVKMNNFNQFNNFFVNEKISTHKEKDNNIDKNISKISINKENVNSKEDLKQYQENTELLLNKIESENKESFNTNDNQNDRKESFNNKNTQINNKLSNNLNDAIDINNNYNLNNNLNINEQNFFPKNYNFNNANSIKFLNQNYIQNIFPFNNNNSFFPPAINYNILNGNNFINNRMFFNGNNYINPLNQINLNFNRINTFNNNINYFNTGQQKKKIIDEYTLEMFGRKGWICEKCNNFNYETRNKCNRCHIKKMPKRILKERSSPGDKKDLHEFDWICKNCKNFNYSFRIICNRCQMKKFD